MGQSSTKYHAPGSTDIPLHAVTITDAANLKPVRKQDARWFDDCIKLFSQGTTTVYTSLAQDQTIGHCILDIKDEKDLYTNLSQIKKRVFDACVKLWGARELDCIECGSVGHLIPRYANDVKFEGATFKDKDFGKNTTAFPRPGKRTVSTRVLKRIHEALYESINGFKPKLVETGMLPTIADLPPKSDDVNRSTPTPPTPVGTHQALPTVRPIAPPPPASPTNGLTVQQLFSIPSPIAAVPIFPTTALSSHSSVVLLTTPPPAQPPQRIPLSPHQMVFAAASH